MKIENRERELPVERVSAYQSDILDSGETGRGNYVTGWYGPFTIERLKTEFMPKLAEYVDQGWCYPFLLSSHRLYKYTDLSITPIPGKKARVSDMKYDRRKRNTPRKPLAIIKSRTEFELLDEAREMVLA